MGAGKLSKRWRVSEEAIREARVKAKRLLQRDDTATSGNYIATLETELIHKVDAEKGTLESTLQLDYEPKNDEELARLHKVDLTKYKISSYWSKLRGSGKFTSSIFCTLRKIDNDTGLQMEAIRDAVLESLTSTFMIPSRGKVVSDNQKVLIVITSDEHVAAANLEDDLYNIPYDKTEYTLRKVRIIEEIEAMKKLHGTFDKMINITLGDNLDGWSGGTTRSGEPGHAHVLPQNMSNKEAVETYIRTNNFYWDQIMRIDPATTYEKHDVVNSNHGGKGLDHIANLGVQIFLEAKYPHVKCHYITKFLGHIELGMHNLILTHGKDESYRKKPLPLNLNPDTEVFIKQYMDYHGLREGKTHVLKGDLHQWNWNTGKFLDYINVGSLYGSSGWVQANYGLTAPSFAIGYLDPSSDDFTLKPVYIDIASS